MSSFVPLLALAAIVAAAPLGAQSWQGRGRSTQGIPPAYRPPPGMCRVWLDGVPPGQQPAPTDCATAVRNRPQNARVIWGDDAAAEGRGKGKQGKEHPRRDDDRRDDDRSPRPRGEREREPDDRDVAGRPWLDDRERDDVDDRWDDDRDGRDDRPGRVVDGRSDDRYRRIFRGGTDVCVDRNRDGFCDDAQRGGEVCVDIDRDGVCDDAALADGGSTLPEMSAGALYARGRRAPTVARWLGEAQVSARATDFDRDGVPDRVTWLDPNGQVVQVWRDRDGDGYADVVEFFEGGRRVRVIGQQ